MKSETVKNLKFLNASKTKGFLSTGSNANSLGKLYNFYKRKVY